MRRVLGLFLVFVSMLIYTLTFNQALVEYKKLQSTSDSLKQMIHVDDIHLSNNSFILDANEQPIDELIGAQNRRYIPLAELPKEVPQAFIATEDQHFYEHKGFDIAAITRSLLINAKKNQLEQGGSTITQQLVRNLYLTNEKRMDRKLKEIVYAHEFEQNLSKSQILELYVNTIYFHNGVYGIETASEFYFGKPIQQLGLAEIAFLCAIPNNPAFYNPLAHEEHTKQRQEWILKKMLEMKSIDQTQYNAAISTAIELNVHKPIHLYPDYTSYVDQEVVDLVALQEGYTEKLAKASETEKKDLQAELKKRMEKLYEGGIKIYTSLDPNLQQQAKTALLDQLPKSQIEGAIVVIDHSSNQIKALVGGKNVERHGLNRTFQSYRQPGSAIKPILVYGPYLDLHPVPITTLVDASNFCKNGYCPENYGGSQYGMVPLETALKYSLNTPAVRLLDNIGVTKAFSYLQPFSFHKITTEDERLPSALGGFTYGVTPLELTDAYTTFSHQGSYKPAHAIVKITDLQGTPLFQWTDTYTPVWKEATNEKMRVLLSKVVKEGTATAVDNGDGYIGGKTGTTDEAKDLWFIGLNEKYTTGVWVGYDQPTNMSSLEQSHPQLLIWKELMQAAK
ncbi:MAG TPA: transglycosylase domain-containing protein [Bacillota bacterium]|nr:transglycosylase domain-containing protein [Bacillota bacterium]